MSATTFSVIMWILTIAIFVSMFVKHSRNDTGDRGLSTAIFIIAFFAFSMLAIGSTAPTSRTDDDKKSRTYALQETNALAGTGTIDSLKPSSGPFGISVTTWYTVDDNTGELIPDTVSNEIISTSTISPGDENQTPRVELFACEYTHDVISTRTFLSKALKIVEKPAGSACTPRYDIYVKP